MIGIYHMFRCTTCKTEFPSVGPSACTKCGSVYVVWLTFEDSALNSMIKDSTQDIADECINHGIKECRYPQVKKLIE